MGATPPLIFPIVSQRLFTSKHDQWMTTWA